jgi:pyridoxal phosphate enzyme (YggS family)
MPSLTQRYMAQRELISELEHAKRATTAAVKLLAVSKTRPAKDVLVLYQVGQRDFGENYLQEALQKQRLLAHLDIAWHFIGPIQSNKTRDIARFFSWVHSVDRIKIAQRLNQQRPANLPPLNICLQVNIDEEETKSGFKLDELAVVIKPLLDLNNLRLRGLMAIPQAENGIEQQRASFKKLAMAKDKLNEQFGLHLDTLSMGMSGDLPAAIVEGSTMVRIGTAIFGARLKSTV